MKRLGAKSHLVHVDDHHREHRDPEDDEQGNPFTAHILLLAWGGKGTRRMDYPHRLRELARGKVLEDS
jgi:hypothetical protein